MALESLILPLSLPLHSWLGASTLHPAVGVGMLSKIVSLSLVALAAGQVQIEGSPEWQADKNAELAHIAPSIGPVAPITYAQSELNHVSPSVGPTPVNHAQALLDWQAAQLAHQAQAAAIVAGHGRRKRQVSVVGSPEWQAYKNAELAHIAPSTGPNVPGVVGNWAQSQLNWIAAQQAIVAAGAGRRKRQAADWQENFVRPSQSWEANYHGQNNWQENFVRPSQSWEAAFVAGHGRRKRQTQAALDFVAPAPGPTPVNFAQSSLDFVGPAPGPTPVNFAQAQLNFQQEALNFIARG